MSNHSNFRWKSSKKLMANARRDRINVTQMHFLNDGMMEEKGKSHNANF
jgi:hypothetical protein